MDAVEPGLLDPVKEKVEMPRYVAAKAEEGKLSFTGVNTGLFFDWALNRGLPVNLKGGPTFLADGGGVALSVTTLDHIGQAVAKAVLKLDQARNRFLYVHSAVVTQKKLLQYAKELAPDRDFPIVEVDTETGAREAQEKIRNGAAGPAVFTPLMIRVTFGLGLGLFKKVDNEFLGLPMKCEEQVKALVASYVKRES
ncbi:hypothetical protein LTR53_015784 [Teratosphaeriaceae sp. CCFEE 6253]|nr:hypothetical protein LTR53_015784 [Teratosphaeriaceae sp. CCFEE 6253]